MFSTTGSFIAKFLLMQTSPWPMVIIFLIGAIFFLVKVTYPTLITRTRAAAFFNILAIVLIMWATLNFGWYLRDNEWGTDEVREARQEEIQRIQGTLDDR